MATRRVCIGDNLATDENGALTIAPWAGVQVLGAQTNANATSALVESTLPGRLMSHGSLLVHNDAPMGRDILWLWSRPSVRLRVAQPNALQVRMKWQVDVSDTEPPESTPNPTHEYDAVVTASVDIGTDGNGVPRFGHYTREVPGGMGRTSVHARAGQYVRCSWSVYQWSPPPFANNAAGNNPMLLAQHDYHVLQAFAFPSTEGGTR